MPTEQRSCVAVYRAEVAARAAKGPSKPPPRSVPAAWKEAARRFQWQERVAAWDAHEMARRRREYEQERLADRHQRITLLRATRAKVAQALAHLDPEEASWRDVLRGVQVVVPELRKEYDDEPAQRHEVTGPDGGPIETVTLTLAQWRALAEQRRAQAEATMALFDDEGADGGSEGAP